MKLQNIQIGLKLLKRTSKRWFDMERSKKKDSSYSRKEYKSPLLKGRYFYVSRDVLKMEDTPTTNDAS